MSEEAVCEFCGEAEPCNKWACRVEMNRREGCPEFTPNNLPIRCIRADGMMLEHEHGDHPDYIFPVSVEYIGPPDETRYQLVDGEGNIEMMDDDCKYSTDNETHALLYTNGSIAVTMYETCSAAWQLHEEKRFMFEDGEDKGVEVVVSVAGTCLGGHLLTPGEWKLTDESLNKISEYLKRKRADAHTNDTT